MKIFKLLKVFLGKIEGKLRTRLSIISGKNFSKPDEVYYLISSRCNFRCEMCPQWKQGLHEKAEENLSLDEVKKIIDQTAAWGIKNFGVCGGEPLLFKDKLLEILKYANQKGLYTHFVTNGWLLDEEFISKYEQVGGGHISLSCDAVGKLHDELRGAPGAFDHVSKALIAFKKVKLKNILLKINTVISDKNLDEITVVIELARKNGASIFLQPFDPYNWTTRRQWNQREYHQHYHLWVRPENNDKLKSLIEKVIEIKKREPGLILNSIRHLQAIGNYFALKDILPKCYIGYKTLFIDNQGQVTCCKFGVLDNVRKHNLKQIWNSKKYESLRKSALVCDYNCLLGCMYAPSIWEWLSMGVNMAGKKILHKKK